MTNQLQKLIQLFVVTSIILSLCSSQVPAAATNPNQLWAEDLEYLTNQLAKRHKNLYFQITKEDFQRQSDELQAALPSLNPAEITVGFLQLVAAVGDSHTQLAYRPQTIYPLALYWFQEGIYLVKAAPEYTQALNYRLVAVNGRAIEEVVAELSTAIPHENPAQIRQQAPQLLMFPEILIGLHLVPPTAIASYTFVDQYGEFLTITAEPVVLEPGIKLVGTNEYQPLYQQHPNQYYWFTYLEDYQTLYVNYSACSNMEGQSVRQFTDSVLDFITNNSVDKLVVDLRNNGGGNSRLLDPFINSIAQNKGLNQAGKIYVVIGRDTFSSAILNALSFKKKTAAIFVGEPTGGKPNHYGEVKYFTLPNSGLAVTYSTKYFRNAPEDTPSLFPDQLIELSIDDYLKGRDPVLEAILLQSNEVTHNS